jgi:hypothetical protein
MKWITTRQKNNELIAIKVELKEEGKVNQIEGESPIKPLLFLQKRLKNKLNFGFSANINKASKDILIFKWN